MTATDETGANTSAAAAMSGTGRRGTNGTGGTGIEGTLTGARMRRFLVVSSDADGQWEWRLSSAVRRILEKHRLKQCCLLHGPTHAGFVNCWICWVN